LIVAALLLPISACDNAGSNEDEVPAVIPPDMFQVGTDLFSGNPKGAAGINFAAGALRVWPVSLIVTAHMILPAAVTAAAVSTTPVFEDGAWKWVASTTNGAQSVQFTLLATPTNPGHDWSMRVSYNDRGTIIDDFELYSGHTENNGTEGDWSLNYLIAGTSTNVLNAVFNKDSETDKTLTLSIPSGDSVTYVEDGNFRSFEWFQSEASLTHLVEWNHVTGAGSITATNFNGGVEACWDEFQDDVACSQ
jgi:hypothetical protein